MVSAALGELITKHGKDLLREAVSLYSDPPYPPNPKRLEDLAVLVLSGLKAEGDGWMSGEARQEGAVVFKVSLAADGWIRKRFPKEHTATEWMKFLETFDSTQVPESSEPTEFTVYYTSPPRKGARY